MILVDTLEKIDLSLASAQKAFDFLNNGQMVYAHRSLCSTLENTRGIDFEAGHLQDTAIKRMEHGAEIPASNSLKGLLERLKTVKKAVHLEIRTALGENV